MVGGRAVGHDLAGVSEMFAVLGHVQASGRTGNRVDVQLWRAPVLADADRRNVPALRDPLQPMGRLMTFLTGACVLWNAEACTVTEVRGDMVVLRRDHDEFTIITNAETLAGHQVVAEQLQRLSLLGAP